MTATSVSVMVWSVVALVFEGYDLYAYGAAVPSLLARADWALSPAVAGVIGSAAVVGMLIGAAVAGVVTDLVGRRPVYVAMVSGFSLGSGLCAWAPTPSLLLAARMVLGLGCGGFIPIALAQVAEYSPDRRRAVNTTVAGVAIGVGGGLGALTAIWVVPAAGYQALFWLGATPLVVVPVAWRMVPESASWLITRGGLAQTRGLIDRYRLPVRLVPAEAVGSPPAASPGPGVRATVAALVAGGYRRATVLFWVAAAMGLLVVFGAQTWLPTLMIKAGYRIDSALALTACLAVGMLGGSILGAYAVRRGGAKPVVMTGFVVAVIALLLLALRPPVGLSYPVVVLLGAGAGGTMNLLQTYLALYYPAGVRGSALGLALGFGRLGAISGPIIVGAVVSMAVNIAWNFVIFAGAAVIGLTALAFIPPTPAGAAD